MQTAQTPLITEWPRISFSELENLEVEEGMVKIFYEAPRLKPWYLQHSFTAKAVPLTARQELPRRKHSSTGKPMVFCFCYKSFFVVLRMPEIILRSFTTLLTEEVS